MIYVNPHISLDENEIEMDFVRSSGPGGQNVNKVATAVQLRFNVAESPSLPDAVRQRLMVLAGNRINKDGVLVIDARQYRTQAANREDALNRLADLVRKAAVRPKTRRPTRPTAASRRRRLESKRRLSTKKRQRSFSPDND